jgi:CRISPR-associated protein Csx3
MQTPQDLAAVLIGGPPHSGKSILAHYLSDVLRARHVTHYLLRSSPDGEGNWRYASDPQLAAELRARAKGRWSPWLGAQLARDVQQRQVPLLVDVGGVVSQEVHAIAAACTHTILIAADEAALDVWRALSRQHQLRPLADLRSSLALDDAIIAEGEPLRGVIGGFRERRIAPGRCLQQLVDRVAETLDTPPGVLFMQHAAQCPVDVLHLEQAIIPLPAHAGGKDWSPIELTAVLASVPAQSSFGLYGRGPNWLYAALAAHCLPEPCWIFDVRRGWLAPHVHIDVTDKPLPITWQCRAVANATQLSIAIIDSYLDDTALNRLIVPPLAVDRGVILDGKLPLWLYAGLARAYHRHPWVAIHHPPLHGYVVVSSGGAMPIGTVLPYATAS